MKHTIFVLLLISTCLSCILAQDPTPQRFATEINVDSAHKHLSVLVSPEFAGRGTNQEGGRKAAAYLANAFSEIGLTGPVDGSFFQPVRLIETGIQENRFKANDKVLTHGTDYYAISSAEKVAIKTPEILFIGYGISDDKYDDLKGVDISGKIVLLINENEPLDRRGNSLITGNKTPSDWSESRNKRLQSVLAHNPALVLATGESSEQYIQRMARRSPRTRITLEDNTENSSGNNTPQATVVHISRAVANGLLAPTGNSLSKLTEKISKTGKPQTSVWKADLDFNLENHVQPFTDDNVVGFLEGTDKKDEIIIVMGHYDHDGIRADGVFFPGADDNGSGTVGVIEVARAFAKAKAAGHGPRRSILFMALAAEEKGLLGADYYTRHPIFPLENTVTALNMDMIGRIDDKHLNGNHNYLHLIGADRLSSELHEINVKVNDLYTNMELDFTYNDPSDPNRFYFRSDHYHFAKNGIPSIFYFSGLHPHYHTPDDTIDKINFEMLVKRAQLVFHTAWEVANRENRLVVDKEVE